MVECGILTWDEWASEGKLKIFSRRAGESTPLTKSAYDGTHEWVYGSDIPSRVAPQEF